MNRPALVSTIAALVAVLVAPAGASAALTSEVSGGELRISGDDAADTVAITSNGTNVAVDFGADATLDANVPRAEISRVVVELGAGEDTTVNTGNLADLAFSFNGGPGSDLVRGTNGADTLVGGSGSDRISGFQANDTLKGGTGADTFTWSPGDGSDTVDGGGDVDLDTLDFDGSAADEIYAITGGDPRVRLTRNIGNVVMLLDRVDVTDLQTLGGVDNVTGSGTGQLTHLRIDAGAGADTVTTGDGADRIDGGTENDNLDGGAAGDYILGGAGLDTLSGREGNDGIQGGDDADAINGGANTDSCDGGAGANTIAECELDAVAPDLVPQPFEHPLEPEEPTVTDPGPQDPQPTDPEPDPVETPATAGFAIDALRADRRGLRVTLTGTGAEAVGVEVGASETVKRAGRSGKRTITYRSVTRAVPAGETITVRLKAPRRHRRALEGAKRRATAKVTNITNGLSETKEIRSSG